MPSAPPALFDTTAVGPAEDLLALLQDRLDDRLRAQGIGDRVLQALRAVPRHEYVAGYYRAHDPAQTPRSLQASPRGWMIGLYGREPLTLTPPSGGKHRITTSMPTVATMLDLLDVTAHHHVLEIGTGSGYTAAVLHQLTGSPVLSVEPDPGWREHARAKLGATARILEPGHSLVRFTAADGGDHGADRVIWWQDMAETPQDWVKLLTLDPPPAFGPRPECLVVTVLAGIITKLVFAEGTVTGTFHRIADPPPVRQPADAPSSRKPARRCPFLPDHLDLPTFRLLLQLAKPRLESTVDTDRSIILADHDSGSFVRLQAKERGRYTLADDSAECPLWTDIIELERRWCDRGRPDFSELSLHCHDGEHVVLHGNHQLHWRPAAVRRADTPLASAPTHHGTRHAL